MSTMIGVSNITNRTDPNSLRSRVFVGNLNTVHMSKAELEAIFSKYGAVIGISVHKGYAFVQYSNEASARAAVIGEDSKPYYNMLLDVTVASEPKNRKRGRSNMNANNPPWNSLPSPNLTDMSLQAQTLNTLASNNNPMIPLQQMGLEGIMGRPNLAQFAAAATSVFSGGGVPPFTGFPQPPAGPMPGTRPNYNRPLNVASASMAHLSSSAKRTRLEGTPAGMNTFNMMNSSNALPLGARGQNLVSLVSPTTDTKGRFAAAFGTQKPDSQLNRNRPSVTGASGLNASAGVRPNLGNRQGVDRLPTAQTKPTTPSSSTATKIQSPASLSSPKTTQPDTAAAGGGGGGDGLTCIKTCANSALSSSRTQPDDILICGSCRKLFDQVDELISHKMAGCSLEKTTCETCRCRAGEPTNLECAYCGTKYSSAWDLMHHCHIDHSLTIYSLPSPSGSPAPPISIDDVEKVENHPVQDSGSDDPCASSSSAVPSRPESGTHEIEQSTNPEGSPNVPRNGEDSQQRGAGSGVSDWDADDEYDGEVTDVGEVPRTPEDVNDDEDAEVDGHPLDEFTEFAMPNQVTQQMAAEASEPEDNPDDSVSPYAAVEQRSPSVEFDGAYTECVSVSADALTKSESSPSRYRVRRRGEYGRHETIADDEDEEDEEEEQDDEDEEEDDENDTTEIASKLHRSS